MSTTTTTTGAKKSLFDLAKKAPVTASKSKEKDSIIVDGISEKLLRLKQARGEAKELETEIKMLEGELKDLLRIKYMDEYLAQKKKPESFKVKGDAGGEMLLIVQDKYLKVDDSKEAALAPFDVIEVKHTLLFDNETLQKYSDVVTDAIFALPIPEADLQKLIINTEEKFVKKGTIERLMQFDDPRKLFELVQPIVMLK